MNTTQPHLMIDIETLDTKPSAAILSIAAVYFDINTGKTGRVFSCNLSVDANIKYNRSISGDTLRWWLDQDSDVMKNTLGHQALYNPIEELYVELNNLKDFLSLYGNQTTIWAYSPAFDIIILKDAFEKQNIKWPLRYDKEMDCRTLVNLVGNRIASTDNLQEHDALQDCLHQIKEVCHAMDIINTALDQYDLSPINTFKG